MAKKPTIFISHAHDDKFIADILASHFDDWLGDTFALFQSSNARAGPTIGSEVDDEVAAAIHASELVVFLYTGDHRDWGWCMYECGIATDPVVSKTRLVIIHFTDKAPDPFRHLVTVPWTELGVLSFVTQLHTSNDFLPQIDGAVGRGVVSTELSDRADSLFISVREAWERQYKPVKYFAPTVDVAIPKDLIHIFSDDAYLESKEDLTAQFDEKVAPFATLTFRDEKMASHFGVSDLARITRLTDLEKLASLYHDSEMNWYTELREAICLDMANKIGDPDFCLMRSVSNPTVGFVPALYCKRLTKNYSQLIYHVTFTRLKIEPGGVL